jgi:hypothetical protein
MVRYGGRSILSAGLTLLACGAHAQSDFDEHVASIRDSGMTERARGDVRTVASILAGTTTFEARRSPDGSVGRSYGGPGPDGTVPTQHQLRARAAAGEAWTDFLKTQADTDHSGFVSTEEGQALRRTIETGLVADQLNLRSLEELDKDLPLTELAHVQEDLSLYSAIRAEAVKAGLVGMPALPNGLGPAPR